MTATIKRRLQALENANQPHDYSPDAIKLVGVQSNPETGLIEEVGKKVTIWRRHPKE